jgi:fructose-specific phosphotransferase system IIC component
MDTHVKVVGWLWIVNGMLSILMAIIGLTVINWPGIVPSARDSLLASTGALCFFLPGIIAYIVAGYGLLKYKGWARILAIILAILNLILFPIGTALGIYTLVIMFNEETKSLFKGEVTPAEVEEVS